MLLIPSKMVNDHVCLKLRAHHLLCMRGFKGYGYSKDFVSNLRAIINHLTAHPVRQIEIIDECDAICAHCPHRKNDRCAADKNAHQRVQARDLKVLQALGLAVGTKRPMIDLNILIEEKLKDPMVIQYICSDCVWKDICLNQANHLTPKLFINFFCNLFWALRE